MTSLWSPAPVKVIPPPTPIDEIDVLDRLAVHEVSHVVVAEAVGMPMKSMDISKGFLGLGGSGCAKHDWDAVAQRRKKDGLGEGAISDQEFHGVLLSCVAGARATALWLTTRHWWDEGDAWRLTRGESVDDYRQFRELAPYAGTGDDPSWVMDESRASQEADELISVNWGLILWGAGELRERRKMTVRELLG